MRTLPAALQSAHSAIVQRPAFLVRIAFTSPVHLSSFATVSYLNENWVQADMDVSRVRVEGLALVGSINFGNADDLFSSLLLNEGTSDKSIRIYGYDAAATGENDFEFLGEGVGGKSVVSHDTASIELRGRNAFVTTPRNFVNQASGFTHLLPAGVQLTINGQTYRLER